MIIYIGWGNYNIIHLEQVNSAQLLPRGPLSLLVLPRVASSSSSSSFFSVMVRNVRGWVGSKYIASIHATNKQCECRRVHLTFFLVDVAKIFAMSSETVLSDVKFGRLLNWPVTRLLPDGSSKRTNFTWTTRVPERFGHKWVKISKPRTLTSDIKLTIFDSQHRVLMQELVASALNNSSFGLCGIT